MTMLAAASIGAIWSSASPDFGTLVKFFYNLKGVLERFGQVKPKILVSVNAVWYNGRVHDHLGKLKAVASGKDSF
jgi:acetoacetyl-CoA synthetase